MESGKPHISLLPRISVNRPVTVTMCLLGLLVVGAVAYSRISVQLFPSGYSPRFLWVSISYRNATPQEAEQQIARPLEEALRTLKGLERLQTYSGRWGVGAPLEFGQGVDMDMAYNQLMDRIERLKPRLPEACRDRVYVRKYNEETDQEVMWGGVAIDPSITDAYRFLDAHVRRPLERIDGVAKVDFWGVYEKELMIKVDQGRLQTRGISTYELVSALQQDNFALSGGHVNEGGRKFYVRSLARYRSVEELRNIPIRTPNGDVRLRDVADVTYDVPLRWWRQRIDGHPAASLEVKRESGANIVAVCQRVSAELARIESDPATSGLRFNVFFNQGKYIEESIHNLRNTGLWGGLFAAMVLLFYLRTVRMTAIITLSIPLCVMITIAALHFVDWSLNIVTMTGLMVGVGMVVDNAIVILENIFRMRSKGDEPGQASIGGASEVALAITMATLTTVVVFLPLIFMGGDAWLTFQLSRIGVPVIIALLGSLFVALIFIPVAAHRFGGRRARGEPRSIAAMRKVYSRSLAWTMQHRRDALLIVLAVFATIVYPYERTKITDRVRGNINDLRIRLNAPANFTSEDVSQILFELEAYLESRKKVYGIRTARASYRKTYGQIQVFLRTDPTEAWWHVAYRDLRARMGLPLDGQMDRADVIEDLRENLPKFVGVRMSVQGRGGGRRDPRLSVYLYGDDTETLAGMLAEVERRLRTIPSVTGVDTDLERADDEVRIRIDRDQARTHGIPARVVGRSIAYSLQGIGLPRYQADHREVRTRLYFDRADRQTLHQLKNYTFRSQSGEEVPLASFASFEMARGSGTIRRQNGKTRLRIEVFANRQDLRALYGEIDQAMQGFQMPRGYSWDKGERYHRYRKSRTEYYYAVAMAVTCVFLLMGVLFESFILPFSVLLSIPFAFLGVYWTLYLTDTPLDIMAKVGLIVLIGVVVNNAIVLVDMVNRLRARGLGREEAILEAGRSRFRPILMTTFTTIFGLLPLAVGNSNLIGIPYAPLGRTMMGGLFSATFLTLFVVPIFYTYLDDLRTVLHRVAATVRPQGRGHEHPQEADD